MSTKNNPGDFDCYANAQLDEPMFILLGRDAMGPQLVDLWANYREVNDEHPDKVAEARRCANDMRAWLAMLGKREWKVPMTINSHLQSTQVRFDKTDVSLKPLPPDPCSECGERPATRYLAVNLRALGVEDAMLTEEKFCEECGADALRDLSASLSEPLNEDGTM
jgi:hypothetical protein